MDLMTTKEKKEFKQRLKIWTKFLESDRDFDYCFILRTLAFKLEQTSKHIKSHDIILDAPKVCKQMDEAATLLRLAMYDDLADGTHRQKQLDKALKIISKNIWSWWD